MPTSIEAALEELKELFAPLASPDEPINKVRSQQIEDPLEDRLALHYAKFGVVPYDPCLHGLRNRDAWSHAPSQTHVHELIENALSKFGHGSKIAHRAIEVLAELCTQHGICLRTEAQIYLAAKKQRGKRGPKLFQNMLILHAIHRMELLGFCAWRDPGMHGTDPTSGSSLVFTALRQLNVPVQSEGAIEKLWQRRPADYAPSAQRMRRKT